jgi:hypothetical protein
VGNFGGDALIAEPSYFKNGLYTFPLGIWVANPDFAADALLPHQ